MTEWYPSYNTIASFHILSHSLVINHPSILFHSIHLSVAQLVEALCYKPEGLEFDWISLDFFHLHNPSGRTMALGSTQSLTEMSKVK